MRLNELRPEEGARTTRRRVGRGVGSGLGKTCGRGHKGQTSRAGGYHKVGFEGGQMPLQRRLPKRGFRSHTSATRAEVRLTELAVVIGDVIDLEVLKATGVVPTRCVKAKIISSGRIGRAVAVHGIDVTAGARVAITQAGGTVES